MSTLSHVWGSGKDPRILLESIEEIRGRFELFILDGQWMFPKYSWNGHVMAEVSILLGEPKDFDGGPYHDFAQLMAVVSPVGTIDFQVVPE